MWHAFLVNATVQCNVHSDNNRHGDRVCTSRPSMTFCSRLPSVRSWLQLHVDITASHISRQGSDKLEACRKCMHPMLFQHHSRHGFVSTLVMYALVGRNPSIAGMQTFVAVTACKECHKRHIHLEREKKGDLQELWHDSAECFILGLSVFFCTDSLGHSWQQQAHQVLLVATANGDGLRTPLQTTGQVSVVFGHGHKPCCA